RLLGAEVVPVTSGDRTLRAAIDEALRAWVSDPEDTYYLLGSVVGPHPYPYLVRELQSVIGREAREQLLASSGALPGAVIACVGGRWGGARRRARAERVRRDPAGARERPCASRRRALGAIASRPLDPRVPFRARRQGHAHARADAARAGAPMSAGVPLGEAIRA